MKHICVKFFLKLCNECQLFVGPGEQERHLLEERIMVAVSNCSCFNVSVFLNAL